MRGQDLVYMNDMPSHVALKRLGVGALARCKCTLRYSGRGESLIFHLGVQVPVWVFAKFFGHCGEVSADREATGQDERLSLRGD